MISVEYKSKSLEKTCTNYTEAQKKYGKEMAELIHLRVDQIKSTPSVDMLVRYSVGRCHPLQGNRKGEYAMDLVHPFRLVFQHKDKNIQLVKIINIEDYH